MAGSADVALNDNWVWPRDMLSEPATKPPMYNWLDALVLKLSPRWDEWTFKLPSIVATLVIAWLIVVMTRTLLRDHANADVIALRRRRDLGRERAGDEADVPVAAGHGHDRVPDGRVGLRDARDDRGWHAHDAVGAGVLALRRGRGD